MRFGLALALVFAMTGCTYNIAGKKDASHLYPRVSMKSASMAAVTAARKANLSVTSSTSPADGMVIVSAVGGQNTLFQSEPARLTLVLVQVDDSVRIEATAIQGGLGGDHGYTDAIVRDVFTALDAQLAQGGSFSR